MLVSDYIVEKNPVRVCCVCYKSNLDGEWCHNNINDLLAARPDLILGEELRFSHGLCSVECVAKGYDLPVEEALEIYQNS